MKAVWRMYVPRVVVLGSARLRLAVEVTVLEAGTFIEEQEERRRAL